MEDILLTNGELYDKIKVHQLGLQHYAFSVFLFNEKDELLLQQRAISKYHSGGLWSNTCCSHFRNNEEFKCKEDVIKLRLKDELGINFNNKLTYLTTFNYKKAVKANTSDNKNYLIENEVDDIFVGKISLHKRLFLNNAEVAETKFVNFNYIVEDVKNNPSIYSQWFIEIMKNDIIIAKMIKYLKKYC